MHTTSTADSYTMDSSDVNEKVCACKGIRTCLVCETKASEITLDMSTKDTDIFNFCDRCGDSAYKDTAPSDHPNHMGEKLNFPGIVIVRNFINDKEEQEIANEIDKTTWVESQSGRKKQDYGPKVNFKRKKLKPTGFSGLPNFSKFLYERMMTLPVMEGFLPVELCNLDYHPSRGSQIVPHFDDFWVWGDRLVTINLLSDTILTMTCDERPGLEVLVPMPARSLIVVHGEARTIWKHAVKRSDICSRRLAITFRELTPEFLPGGQNEETGRALLDIALTFNGTSVGSSS